MTVELSNQTLATAVEARRSNYSVTDQSTLSAEELQALVENAIRHTPSAYNSQTTRAVLVLGDANKALWADLWTAFSADLPEAAKGVFEGKFTGVYSKGYGTVVFFEDQAALDAFSTAQPRAASNVPQWSENANGIAQYIIWTQLTAAGMGANLQHYNLKDVINKKLGVPESWVPKAQLVFGVAAAAPGAKTFLPIEERVKVVQ